MKTYVFDTPQFVEGLTIRVAPNQVETYIQLQEDLFLDGLRKSPGFLGGEVWLSQDKPGEVTSLYFWQSEEDYKNVDTGWLLPAKEAIKRAVESDFIRSWHGEDRRFRLKEYR